jgi:uncharacterized protein (TIGR03435 family)
MRYLVALVAASLYIGGVRLQADDPHFEVASIKANNSGPGGDRFLTLVPGGVRVVNLPLSTILWMAHGVQREQIVDLPSWANVEAFDITAKGNGVTGDTFRPMLVNVLAERFALKTHHEMREMNVYRLLRVDEKSLGPKLHQADYDCAAAGTSATRPDPELAAKLRNCGAGTRPGGIGVHGMPLRAFTRFAGPMAGRIIVDETGITGNVDLDLEFSADNPDGPSLFTAVREQLGLKLETGRAPVDVIVIDHIDRPTDD